MRVGPMVRQLCSPWSSAIHESQLRAVMAVTQAIASGGRLSVSAIGRAVEAPAFVKHRIKRVDRLLSNPRMHRDRWLYFEALAAQLIGTCEQPVVLLDWTKTPSDFYALVAAVPGDGRALTIYEEVHPEKRLANPRVEARFLRNLRRVLPDGCRPIVVTDAGFRGPFLHQLQALGWDFVGRLRSNTQMRPAEGTEWMTIPEIYATATPRARKLGSFRLYRTRKQLLANLVLVGPRRYPRKHPWRGRSPYRGGLCPKTINGAKEPWLLVTSLDLTSKAVVNIYAKRMQIEEIFRDTKNSRFGWCLRHARSRSAARLTILLLLAAIAMLAVILVGRAAEVAGVRARYQANTETRRVLSLFMLGLQILRDPHRPPLAAVVPAGLRYLRSIQNLADTP